MKVFNYLSDIYDIGPVCLALGNFDGLHIGHRALAEECMRICKEKELTPVLFSFRNHPGNLISGQNDIKHISSLKEKCLTAESMGFKYMVNIRFTENIMRLSPEKFIDNMLLRHMDVKAVVCGFNYSFGAKAAGDHKLLEALGRERGIEVSVLEEQKLRGKTVSSTFIRQLLAQGDTKGAAGCLGRPFRLYPDTVRLADEGLAFGFSASQLLPGEGDYSVRISSRTKKLRAAVHSSPELCRISLLNCDNASEAVSFEIPDAQMYSYQGLLPAWPVTDIVIEFE